MPPRLDILVLADLHAQAGPAQDARPAAGRELLLAGKALRHLRQRGIEPGLVVALGDLGHGGRDRTPEESLRGTLAGLRALGPPAILLPGNHDGPPGRFVELGGTPAGLHEVGGYGFLVFHDLFREGDRSSREAGALGLPARIAAGRPGLPLVALQHALLHPAVGDPYPYRTDNAEEILASYRDAGVVLSLGGHYHAGVPLHEAGGVPVYGAPALAEPPFRFAHVRLEGRAAHAWSHQLELPGGLWDLHNHTEFAYCGKGISAEASAGTGRLLGLSGMAFTEHAFQLYLPPDPAWSFSWQREEREWLPVREHGGGSMPAYRALVQRMRLASPPVPSLRFGLELDLCADGGLLLHPADRMGWDLLVGAVHEIPDAADGALTPGRAERIFLRDTERVLAHRVDILAHPLRWWEWKKIPVPAHLFGTVARLLAGAGAACEVNFHNASTSPSLVRACLERGVRISLGGDAHVPEEAADLWPHLRLLAEAGLREEDLPGALFVPAG